MIIMRALSLVAIFAAALLAYVVYSCWPPEDLTLVSVRIARVGDARIPHDVGPRGAKDLYAIIEFKTSKNLARFAQNGLYEEIFNDKYICGADDKEDKRIGGAQPLVYDRYGPIGLAENPKQKIGHSSYWVYMNLKQDSVGGATPYDLLKHPQDVCFIVSPQLAFVGVWPPSNEVRIPKEVFVKVIDQFSIAHAPDRTE